MVDELTDSIRGFSGARDIDMRIARPTGADPAADPGGENEATPSRSGRPDESPIGTPPRDDVRLWDISTDWRGRVAYRGDGGICDLRGAVAA